MLGLVVALSSFYLAPHISDQQTTAVATRGSGDAKTGTQGGGPSDNKPGAETSGGPVAGGPSGSAAPGTANHPAPADLSCPGKNGGATDVGVDAHNINLAATEVESGIGQSFLGPVRYGMLAVLQKTNRQGGICGRLLKLTLKDDGWDPTRGKQFIDNFIQSDQYFALAVVPSSEGLNQASASHDIDRAPDPVGGGQGIPVVGSDGMLNSQYADPWIWPVAASTATSMRIMAHDAYKRGARNFGIVFDQNYRFGPEGAGAFVAQIGRDGGTISTDCRIGLTAGQEDYGTQVKLFNENCGDGSKHNVDFVALLLEPQTAEAWLHDNPYLGHRANGTGYGAAGPQPLFDIDFANTCGATCQGLQVWTSFFPPIYPFDQQKAVQAFKNDLCAVDSNCESHSQSAFTESGYVGMLLLVDALKEASPFLTRQRLKDVLDAETLDEGLTGALTFRPGRHQANLTMVAFVDQYSSNATFQIVRNSQQNDPCPTCTDKAL